MYDGLMSSILHLYITSVLLRGGKANWQHEVAKQRPICHTYVYAPFLLCSLVLSTDLISLLDVCLYTRPKESLNLVLPVRPHFHPDVAHLHTYTLSHLPVAATALLLHYRACCKERTTVPQ